MMGITIDINGREIGRVGVWNTQEYDGLEVRYQVHDLRGSDGGTVHDHPKICDVWHNRDDGAAALTAKVMREVGEEWLDELGLVES